MNFKLISNTGSVHHLGVSATGDKGHGPRSLCGREMLREGRGAEVTGRQCKSCTRLAERQEIVAETARKSLAKINPTHPDLKPGEPVEIFGTIAGAEILTAAVPNGDPERVAYFIGEAGRMGYTSVRAALVTDPRTRQAYINCAKDDAAVEADTEPERGVEGLPADPAPVMHYGVPRILCGAEPEYIGSDHCKGGDGPCPNACPCGCNTGEFECQCSNLTETLADVTCKPCKDGLHRPVDARSDAMVDRTASDDRTAPQDAVWDRESTERALSGSEMGAPELNTGHTPLYDFPVTVTRKPVYDRSALTLPGAIEAADKIEAIVAEGERRRAESALWRVVDTNTGQEVTLPTARTDFRGDMGTVTGIADHPQPGKSGKLYHDRTGRVCYPGVYALKIVPAILPESAGRWLDGHQGWRNNYRVVDVATEYGFVIPEEYRDALDRYRNGSESEGIHEAICGQGELSDMATDYLNENAPDGYVFVWDMGELSLMTESDAQYI